MSENVYGGSPLSGMKGSTPENRRGRPKATAISNLINEGVTSQSPIRCEVCSRVFPRDKSLQAHRRVHTGERPYSCDYPGCMRKFKQSGQLKTHQRLHTGERPFVCSVDGCPSRFTHANRHCSTHPKAPLMRSEDSPNPPCMDEVAFTNEDVRLWFIKYRAERETKSVEKTPRSIAHGTGVIGGHEFLTPRSEDRELTDMTNLPMSPVKTPRIPSPDRSRPVKNLFLDSTGTPTDEQNDHLFGTTTASPRKRELPKKRWLRTACRELGTYVPPSTSPTITSPTFAANLHRPTVLRHASAFCQSVITPPTLTPPLSEERPKLNVSFHSPPHIDQLDLEELAVPLPPLDNPWPGCNNFSEKPRVHRLASVFSHLSHFDHPEL